VNVFVCVCVCVGRGGLEDGVSYDIMSVCGLFNDTLIIFNS